MPDKVRAALIPCDRLVLLGQEAIWLSESLRILREEAPDVEITLMTKSSPELADGLMQGKIDVALSVPKLGKPVELRQE